MRALLWIAVAMMAVWSGYWFVGKSAVEEATQSFIATARDEGIVIEDKGRTIAGFPNRFDLTIASPVLSDPRSGWSWQADFLQVFSLSYKPWHLIAAFAPHQVLNTPFESLTLASEKLQASLVVKPSTTLDLDRTTLVGTGLSLRSDMGWQVATESLRFATRLDETRQNTHEIGLEVLSIAPDPSFSALIPDLPTVVDRLRIDAFAGFSGPLDRNMGQSRPRITSVVLREAMLVWGELSVFAQGDLQAPDGVAQGQIDIRIQGWRHLVTLMVATGAVKPEVAPTIERMLETLAQQSGDPQTLNLPLTFVGGQMKLGPLPLGPAPRLN